MAIVTDTVFLSMSASLTRETDASSDVPRHTAKHNGTLNSRQVPHGTTNKDHRSLAYRFFPFIRGMAVASLQNRFCPVSCKIV